MILQRSYQKELMDDLSIEDRRIDRALNELRVINRVLGGTSVSKRGITYFLNDSANVLNVIDIGGGASDILYDLKRTCTNLEICSVDINKYACDFQKNSRKRNNIICADAFTLPIKEKSFDVVHASLFLHHFNEAKTSELVNNFIKISRKGVVINDLRRNILAYLGIKVLTSLFSKSAFVKNDGPLSVRRAFTKKELMNILSGSGIKYYILKRMWAFRFLLIIPAVQNE